MTVDKDIFSEIARESTIANLVKMTVFYDDVYKLPKSETLYFTKQILIPKGVEAREVDPLEIGTSPTRGNKTEHVDVTFVIKGYEANFRENKFQIKSLSQADFLASQVKVTNENLALKLDNKVLSVMKAAATAQNEAEKWMAAGIIYPERIKAGLVTALQTMAETLFFTSENEDDKAVLYLPYAIKIGLKDYDSEFRSEKVLDMVKGYVKEVKFTRQLTTEAILAYKNDQYGTLALEFDESPIVDYDDSSKTQVLYTTIAMMDVQVVPEDEAGKTKRIINITNIM